MCFGNCPLPGPIAESVNVTATVSDTPVKASPGVIATALSFVGQVLSDTAVGFGKQVANTALGVDNAFYGALNYFASYFTDFRFPTYEYYEAATAGEPGGMYATALAGVLTLAGGGALALIEPEWN